MSVTLPAEAAQWASEWRDRINDRPDFEAAAAEFTASFRFEIMADDSYDGAPVTFAVDVEDGRCTDARLADGDDYDFALRGPYGAWKSMLRGELDVSESVMNGTFDVEGNTMRLLRRQDAIAEMVGAAQAIDTEFEH